MGAVSVGNTPPAFRGAAKTVPGAGMAHSESQTIVRAATAARTPSRAGFEPAYLRLLRGGELAERARLARAHLEDCDLCTRYCRVNRLEGTRGAVCRTGERAVVSSFGPHHGEEGCLRGRRGATAWITSITAPSLAAARISCDRSRRGG